MMVANELKAVLRDYPGNEVKVVATVTLLAVTLFDGYLAPNEFSVLATACDAWDLDIGILDRFILYPPDEILVETLSLARVGLSPEGRLWFLDICIGTARADERLLFGEQILLLTIADALGVPSMLFKERYKVLADKEFPSLGDPSTYAYYQRTTKKESRQDGGTAQSEASRDIAARPFLQELGLEAGCTIEDIKTAYRKIVLACHPDRFTHDSENEARQRHERFIRVKTAYEQLMVIYA